MLQMYPKLKFATKFYTVHPVIITWGDSVVIKKENMNAMYGPLATISVEWYSELQDKFNNRRQVWSGDRP